MAGKLPLKYKQDFDPDKGAQAKICRYVTVQTAGNNDKIVTESEEIRKFTGSTVEELCYTIDCFKTASKDLHIEEEDLKDEFVKCLTPGPRRKWEKMEKL